MASATPDLRLQINWRLCEIRTLWLTANSTSCRTDVVALNVTIKTTSAVRDVNFFTLLVHLGPLWQLPPADAWLSLAVAYITDIPACLSEMWCIKLCLANKRAYSHIYTGESPLTLATDPWTPASYSERAASATGVITHGLPCSNITAQRP